MEHRHTRSRTRPHNRPQLVTCALIVAASLGCCMLPFDYDGTIAQRGHEALIIHDGEREELVLRINYAITGADDMPDQFAWVITTPSEPDAYAVADAALFRDLGRYADSRMVRYRRVGALSAEGGLHFSDVVKVGPYEIQPIKAVGRDALDGLNAWLESNGFPTEDPAHMTYFVDHGFTFLCIKITPPDADTPLDAAGKLKPLHLSFATRQPYYPLRFSSRQGVFNANLYLLTRDEFDREENQPWLDRLHDTTDKKYRPNHRVKIEDLPETVGEVFKNGHIADWDGRWYLNKIDCKRVNRDNEIASWPGDVFFE